MQPRTCQSGIALVIVLWMLTLLTIITGSIVFSSRTDTLLATNRTALAKAQTLADAGIHRAIYELSLPVTVPQRWLADGRLHEFSLDTGSVRTMITGESGKIDINTAPDALLRLLLQSTGADDATVNGVLDAILDWRDADSLRRLHGAEADDYAAANRHYGPANAKFSSVEELRQVMGVTADLYRRLEGSITVYSRGTGINTAMAPREVLAIFPGATPTLVDAYIEQRQVLLAQGLPVPIFAPAGAYHSAGGEMTVHSIWAEAILPDGTRFLRNAVIRLTPDPKNPVIFLAWRSPSLAKEGGKGL